MTVDNSEKKALLLGIGNDILMDDGIGPRLVNDIKEITNSDRFDYANINLGGLEVLEFIKGYEELVIIDAIKTKKGKPGDVYMLTPDDFIETCHLSNFHDVSFLTALKLGAELEMGIPETILIIAVEIVEDTCFGVDLSPELEKKYDDVFNEVFTTLYPLINGDSRICDILNNISYYEESVR